MLEEDLAQEISIKEYKELNGIDLASSVKFTDNLEIVADIVGVPQDNCDDPGAVSESGQIASWAYSRDWMYYDWDLVISGEITVDRYLSGLMQSVAIIESLEAAKRAKSFNDKISFRRRKVANR